MQTYLQRHSDGRYYYRRRIPNDLIEHYGRDFIRKALGTADPAEAKRLASAKSVEYDNEFDAIRANRQQSARGQMPDATSPVSVIPDSPALQSQQPPPMPYLPPQLRGPLSGDREGEALAILAKLRRKRAVAEEAGAEELKGFMTMASFAKSFDEMVLSGSEESSKPLWWHEASLMAHRAFLDGAGQSGISLLLKTQPVTHTQAVGHSGNTGETTSLDKLVEYWKQDGSHSNIRTIEKMELVVRRFKKIVDDLPIQVITKKQCVAFRDAIRASGKTISTTIDHTDKLRALFAVAKSRDLIQQNPAEGLTLKDSVSAKEKRMPFDTPALVRIFSSPVYTTGERPKAGAGEAAYWLPLLALFTGARLEELGQLHPDDVYQETYEDENRANQMAWVLRIAEVAEGQSVKNKGSIRRVPLHAELIRLGFIEFVEARRKRARIFYELKPDTRGRETGNWSKWFGNWRRKRCGVTGSRMAFHSFRHLFKDLCREVGIDEPVNDAMTGHVGDGNRVARAYGAGKYPLRPLVEGMRKFKVPADLQAVLDGLSPYRA